MSNGTKYAGTIFALIATVGIIFTTGFWEWKRNSAPSSDRNFQQLYSSEGLWVRCNSASPGLFGCDQHDKSLIALPGYLHGMRAMMCLAVISVVLGATSAALSLPCIRVGSQKQKVMIARVGGAMVFVAGSLCLVAVSWYAAVIVFEFWSSANSAIKYEFGTSLYVGWMSSGVALVAGILLVCCNSVDTEDDADVYRYDYRPPQASKPKGSAEYV